MMNCIYNVLPPILISGMIFGLIGLVFDKKISHTYQSVFNRLLAFLFVSGIGGGILLISTFRLFNMGIGILLLSVGIKIFDNVKKRCPADLQFGLLFTMLFSGCNAATTVLFVFSPFLLIINVYTLIMLGNILL